MEKASKNKAPSLVSIRLISDERTKLEQAAHGTSLSAQIRQWFELVWIQTGNNSEPHFLEHPESTTEASCRNGPRPAHLSCAEGGAYPA